MRFRKIVVIPAKAGTQFDLRCSLSNASTPTRAALALTNSL